LVKTIHKIDWNPKKRQHTDLGLEVEVVEKYQSIKGLRSIVVMFLLVFLILMPTD
jgi:hypothetical protein